MEIVTLSWRCVVITSPLLGLRCAGHLQFIKPQLFRGTFLGKRQHLTAGAGGIHPSSPWGALEGAGFPDAAYGVIPKTLLSVSESGI